ncbi:MAG: hypothetical protein DBY14_01190 [Escherichia coli]|nr:MAG: hypothetical protein DBY14_01190 [Escherichia coli]
MSDIVSEDKIHFLNTGHSDCIILESQGKFAMIDAAEDNDYPANKPFLNLKGYEDVVVDYLVKNCSRDGENVDIEFVLGTHAHSDHIGGFDTVINDSRINVKKAYLKKYDEKTIFFGEIKFWDNMEVYQQMMDACKNNNVEIVQNIKSDSFMFGNFKITFLNTENKKRFFKYGENIDSVVTLVEKNGTKVLLVGDLNYKANDEKPIADKVGKVDMLKVGHHGYFWSTSNYFAKKLAPKYSVITNTWSAVYPDVKHKLTKVAKSQVLCTQDENGVIAVIGDNGKIDIQKNIMNV